MSQYDITKGYNHAYDLFDDVMINTKTTQGIYTAGISPYTINTGGGGGAGGQTLTVNGNYSDTLWATATTSISTPLHVRGDAEIDGDIKIKGKSLSEAIDNIEKRLAILHPNKELEKRWEQLKALGEQYRELEKNILEKEKIWEILKK